MPTAKPWTGVIPPEDVASFSRGFDPQERPLTTGVRPAVVVVDMTREFVDDLYPTGFGQTGRPAATANVELLQSARTRGLPVFFTKAYPDAHHRPRPAERGRWNMIGVEPPPADLPPGDVLVDVLSPEPDDIVIYKGRKPSAFFGTPLLSHLIYGRVDTVIVTGMTTSGCVRATAVDAFQYNLHVVIPHECVADRSQISHQVSLFDLHMKYADVASLAETLAYVDALSV